MRTLLLLSILIQSHIAHAQSTAIPSASQSSMESMLATEIGDFIQDRLSGTQGMPVLVNVKFNPSTNTFIIDLGSAFLPKDKSHLTGEIEERMHQIALLVRSHVEETIPNAQIDFTFDGNGIEHYYPSEYKTKYRASPIRYR